jgi:glutathione S-transferase
MLTLCGQAFKPVWTDFGSRVTGIPEWRRDINPMGEVPVLEEDGAKLTPILLHLAEKFRRYGGEGETGRFEGCDLGATHPHVHAWLGRIAALPDWRAPYDLLPGRRLTRIG